MKKALGRGLESIIAGTEQREVRNIPISNIKPNPFQPRKVFKDEELKELADSIKENGVLQPITVRRVGEYFEIVTGERRYRACKMLGLKDIPAIIKNISNDKMVEWALIENVQRENLNVVEEAEAYRELAEKFNLTHEDISKKVGKSRAHITNILRVLELEDFIKDLLKNNRISFGHAKVLLSIKEPLRRKHFAERIYKEDLSVRDLEKLLSSRVEKTVKIKEKKKSIHLKDIESKLSERLSRKVTVKYKKGKGNISLEFYNDDDFKKLLIFLGLKNFD
ncbi:MAG: putative Transcriptional regulator [candidate division TA06 bacterium 32_111]|uniref:Chromosome partitioning protein ParB n=2 Tax=Bacteria candidate phyla TaxID=1783234 RepID=A0A348ML43_UNCW3|nr:MAG: putative Transcriptional regulator [candidate division TA06 bacterium 32_111]KUK87397.1 MAG: putative Transcriptional regulator [candidate division TA06 bacterium 34_109]HAF07769.1 chromosome partitioning protein ParB [candidate division WOR-3 bacterium]HCP17287.1 chromosome partitioning protein ParB [candidate division WOR-3 bacterium]